MLHVDLGAEIESQLVKLAAVNGQSIEDTLREMVRVNLSQIEPPREFRPNAETLEAFAQIERGEYKTFNTVEELMADLYPVS